MKNVKLNKKEILFLVENLKNEKILSLDLMDFAKLIADKYGCKEYFCGLEPADDIHTRLFTNQKRESLGR